MVTEVKNTPEETNSIITEEENRISELEDRMIEMTTLERNEEKGVQRNEDNLRDL